MKVFLFCFWDLNGFQRYYQTQSFMKGMHKQTQYYISLNVTGIDHSFVQTISHDQGYPGYCQKGCQWWKGCHWSFGKDSRTKPGISLSPY